MKETIGSKYFLPRDNSGFNSGLVEWYNSVIDKSEDELSIEDLQRWLQQNQLVPDENREKLVSMIFEKCINIFLENPFAGEEYGVETPGALLSRIVNFWPNIKITNDQKSQLLDTVTYVERNTDLYEWSDPDDPYDLPIEKDGYYENLEKLKAILMDSHS